MIRAAHAAGICGEFDSCWLPIANRLTEMPPGDSPFEHFVCAGNWHYSALPSERTTRLIDTLRNDPRPSAWNLASDLDDDLTHLLREPGGTAARPSPCGSAPR